MGAGDDEDDGLTRLELVVVGLARVDHPEELVVAAAFIWQLAKTNTAKPRASMRMTKRKTPHSLCSVRPANPTPTRPSNAKAPMTRAIDL